jgi:hypothetical protein
MLQSQQLEHHVEIAFQSAPTDLCFTVMFCAQQLFPFIYTIAIHLAAAKMT